MQLVRQRGWLIAVIAAITGALFAAWLASLQPPRAVAEVYIPPLPEKSAPGGAVVDPVDVARDASLTVEAVDQFKLDVDAHELASHVDAEFDRDTGLLKVRVTRFGTVPEVEVANRLAQRVLEKWNIRLDSVRGHYDQTLERRTALGRTTDRLRARLARAEPDAAGPLLTGLAEAEAELSRMDSRLLEVGPRSAAEAFVYRTAERESAWTPKVVGAGALLGLVIGAAITISSLGYYSRRRGSGTAAPDSPTQA